MGIKNKIRQLKISKRSMLSFFLVLLAVLLFFVFRKPLFVLLMILIGGLSTIHKRFTHISFGFELMTLFSVVITYAYGMPVGLISAYLMLFISHFTTATITPAIFVRMGTYTIVVVLAGLFSNHPIAIVGVILGIIVYIITPILKIFIFGNNPVSSLISAMGGMIFNYIFFTKLAETLLKILA